MSQQAGLDEVFLALALPRKRGRGKLIYIVTGLLQNLMLHVLRYLEGGGVPQYCISPGI